MTKSAYYYAKKNYELTKSYYYHNCHKVSKVIRNEMKAKLRNAKECLELMKYAQRKSK